jgi:2-polyprenyl-6-methoxyphenol hydroxylase-like FAD-dependent oxidoreductase
MNSDIIVVGAGPAGLSFAAAAAAQGLTVTLVEKQPLTKLAKPDYDGREIALTHCSRRIMSELGLWQCVPPKEISLIRDAKVLNGTSSYALHFSADEAGEANLGFMMSNHLIRKAAYEAATAHQSVKVLAGRSVTEVGTDEDEAWVKLDNGKRLSGELLIAADSPRQNGNCGQPS